MTKPTTAETAKGGHTPEVVAWLIERANGSKEVVLSPIDDDTYLPEGDEAVALVSLEDYDALRQRCDGLLKILAGVTFVAIKGAHELDGEVPREWIDFSLRYAKALPDDEDPQFKELIVAALAEVERKP